MLKSSGWFLPLCVVCVLGVSRPPMITRESKYNVFFKPFETVQIPCEGNGEPFPTFSWTRNGFEYNPSGNDARVVQLHRAGTLVFNSPEEKDEGIFQCIAKNDFGTAVSINVNLRVAVMENFLIASETKHTPTLGLPYKLKCTPPESIPPAEVLWIIKDELGFDSISYTRRITMDREFNLRFANVVEEDHRNGYAYACMAVNNIMRTNSQGPLHTIKVEGNTAGYQPVRHAFSDQDDRHGLRGNDLAIYCIFSGYPTPDVHWERTDNRSFPLRAQFKSMSQKLVITDLQYEDAGSYECWADNIASSGKRQTRTFNIVISSAPIFTQRPESVETEIGATVQFTCMAESRPKAEIHWLINGVPLADSTVELKNSGRFKTIGGNVIQLERVEKKDFMVFQCNATNKHGYVFANAYLNVLSEAPKIIVPPQPMLIAAEGIGVALTCRTTGKPNPVITWFKDGTQVTGGRYLIWSNGDLHIEHLVLADAGYYICEAKNIHNVSSADGQLVVRRRTKIEQRPGDLERNRGMDAKFTCSGTTDPEEVTKLRIYWQKDGKEITVNDERMMTNYQDNSLTISGTITRDTGTYTCVATNGLDSDKASAVLTVKDRPESPIDVVHEDCNKDLDITISWMPGSYNNAPIQYYIVQYNTAFNPNQWTYATRVNASISKVKLELSPGTNYTFRVIAYNKIGPSDASAPTPDVCKTTEARPEYHPQNLKTIGNRPNTLYIEWTPIPEIQQNGEGFYYELEIQQLVGDGDPKASKITKTITNWEENYFETNTGRIYQPYEISIKARNNINDANGDAITIIGHSFESTPTISPTNFEVLTVEATKAEFQWDFEKKEIDKMRTKINGEFRGFKIQFWQENHQALTIREADIGPEITLNLTGNRFRETISDMLPNTHMMARISVMNNFYVGKPTDAIKFYTKPGYPGPVDYFRILNIGDTHVNLEWGTPEETRGDLMGYDISYQIVNGLDLSEMQDREPQINDPFTTNAYLSGLEPRKKYRVHIFARTQAGRGEGYFIEFVTAKPGTPKMPRFKIMDVGSHFINISWWVDAYSSSGSVVFAEYRKLDGAEWIRTTDEVVNTWKNISFLEPGTTYEVRIKSTNGFRSVSSSIAEVTTDGTAVASALVGNIGWFLGMLFSILLLIGLIVLFYLCYRRGFQFHVFSQPDYAHNTSGAYSGTYDNTDRMDQGSDRFGPEPRGYNNDYYDDKDYHDPNYADNVPPKYPADYSSEKPPLHDDYEDYNRKPSRDYDDGYEKQPPSAPVDYRGYPDNYYGDQGRQDDYYDRRDDDYYGRQDDYYDRRDDGHYDRRDDGHYDRQDDGYDYYDRRDNGYSDDRRDYNDDDRDRNGRNDGRKGYDYDSDEPPRRSTSSHAVNGNSSSTVV